MKTKNMKHLYIISLLLLFTSCNTTTPSDTTTPDKVKDETLSHKQALTLLQETYTYSYIGHCINLKSSLFDRHRTYPAYYENIQMLSSLGLIHEETKHYSATYTGTPAYQRTTIKLTDIGREKHGVEKDNLHSSKVYIAHDSVTGIMGISLSNDGNSAQVKFSITQNETPFISITKTSSLASYEKKRRSSQTAHFIKYDTGWVCEDIEEE